MALKAHRKALAAGGVLALLLAVASSVLFDRWVENTDIPSLSVETSVVVEDRNQLLLRAYTVADGRWRLPAVIGDVDPRYISGLLAYEDKRFYWHSGVDPKAVLRAVAQAIWNGRIVSGGSTLTMQVARLLEESGTGRLGPKLRQARLAMALERKLSKEEILNLYLLLAPFGGNLEGVRAASRAYFDKEPGRLTPAQIALLIALPQSPEKRRPDKHPESAKKARDRVLIRLTTAGELPLDEATAGKHEIIPSARKPFPSIAAHLSDRVRRADRLAAVHGLTIERSLQKSIEKLVVQHVSDNENGVSAAVLVMDHQNGEILASVGSAGYLDHERLGFVDMTKAIRSPGSTLKPLIYGLAFDRGLAHPDTLIEDRPTAFGEYAPQNFDKQFYGTVSVRSALQHSLNIPAVALLEAVGPAQLMATMRRAGVKAKLPSSATPGLAIALGGLGLSLEDLVVLYGGIARGGLPARPKIRVTSTADIPLKRMLSAESAWQIGNVLTGVKGPFLSPDNDLAFKTGTSYGYRDAWAVGFDGRHVIGVWLGRPDGASVPGILGADLAAPLLFDVFSRLKPKLDPLPVPPPATLLVSNADLPQPLKRFRGPNWVFKADIGGPEIAFPPDGARMEMLADGPLVVKVRNGTPPFTWIADGIPVQIATRERQAELFPSGRGFLDLSVIDVNGLSERVRVELH